jgi:hypothetical protein
MYTRRDMLYTRLVPCSPYSPAPLDPFVPLDTLTWNPPCCDRIRPPRPPVARELTLCPFVQPSWLSTQNPDPPGFPDPNLYLIRTTLRTQPQMLADMHDLISVNKILVLNLCPTVSVAA